MPKIGSSPMNLAIVMSPTTTAAGVEGATAPAYAIVFYHDKFDPPEGWKETETIVPDPAATCEIVIGDLGPWNKRSDKYAIYQKT